MKTKEILMIFTKNPELGEVKTRLAKTVGDERALEVYRDLLQYTHSETRQLECDKMVWYSNAINNSDLWTGGFDKHAQEGKDLGERMLNAFALAFREGYEKAIIIGSDCYELNVWHLREAFAALDKYDIVIGPANDGGYYLLGMKRLHLKLFTDKPWSTSDLLVDTLLDIKEMNLSYSLLDTLSDIDTEEDLKAWEAQREVQEPN